MLNDNEIGLAIAHRRLVFEPPVSIIHQLGPVSLDLRLSNDFWFPKDGDITLLVDSKIGENFDYAPGPVYLNPGQFILGLTKEKITMPTNLVGRLTGRSRTARKGFMPQISADIIDPGFEGQITLEIVNLGPFNILLREDDMICSISFTELRTPAFPYQGSYQNQDSAL
jgi:dCTP deaminase